MATNSQDDANDDEEYREGGAGRPEIVKTERNVPFLGLTRHNSVDLPDVWGHGDSIRWWAEDRWGNESDDDADPDIVPDDLSGLSTVIRDLPRATTAEVAWIHPQTGETIKTGKHNAVVNPEVVEHLDTATDEEGGFEFSEETVGSVEEARAEWGDQWRQHVIGDDALYQIPTDTYTVVNPMEFLEPLTREIRERDLGDSCFGEFRLFRSGGKVSADVLFNGEHVEVPGRSGESKPIVVGFQIDWDHFSGTSINAQGMALNYECTNAFRAFTDQIKIKHTGDLQERTFTVGDETAESWQEVWSLLFDIIDKKKDYLADIIEAAMEQNLDDLIDLPDSFGDQYADEQHPTLFALYRFMGYPEYLARHAAKDCYANAEDPTNPSWWDIHSGATYAVTHHSRADQHGSSQIKDQMGIANDALNNPTLTAQEVERNWNASRDEDRLADEEGGEATIIREESIEEAQEQYERRQERLQALAPEMDE